MNKDEILSASKSENEGMDERQHKNYQIAYITGGLAAILLAAIFQVYEIISGGNRFGYLAICLVQPAIMGIVFGLRTRESKLGKLYMISGCGCTIVCILSIIAFFVKEMI